MYKKYGHLLNIPGYKTFGMHFTVVVRVIYFRDFCRPSYLEVCQSSFNRYNT